MVDRRDELAMLRQRLPGPERLVTLTGPGGIGKSWLARHAVESVDRTFPHGAYLVELGDVPDADLIACTVAGTLGLRVDAAPGDVSALCLQLAARQALLALDRCEHLLPDVARFVTALLQGCPMLHVLVTSREPLRVAGERIVLVGPLAVPPDASGADPVTALSHDAVALFVERATAVARDFRLTEDNVAVVSALCARLDGNPLALELAAARIGVLGPQAILERLDDRYRLLTRGVRASSQLRSLRASVDASWDLCTAQERTLWARLSVFPADFDLDAVEQVCAGDGIEEVEVLDLVDSLLAKSVVAREADATTVRFSMSETLRAYGIEQLGKDARRVWSDRHLRWCARLVDEARDEWFGPRQPTRSRQLRREHANVRAALDWATRDPGRAPDALRMLAALESWWVLAGQATEARHWLSAALRHGTGTPDQRAGALALAAWFASTQGDAEEAVGLLDDAFRIPGATAPETLRMVARARGGLAVARGDLDAADALFLQSVDVAVSENCPGAEAEGWWLVGVTRFLGGRADDAEHALRRCVTLARRAGESHLRASALAIRALAALDRGQAENARRLAQEALQRKVDVGDWSAVAFLVEVLAWAALAESDPVRAAVLLGAADGIWTRTGLSPALLGPLASYRTKRRDTAHKALVGRGSAGHLARGAALSTAAAVRYAVDGVLSREADDPTSDPLTPRELAVAELVARGLSNREIATALVISVRTVQGHIESILRKLGFGSRAQVAAWVARRRAGPSS